MAQRHLVLLTVVFIGACMNDSDTCPVGDAPVALLSTEVRDHYVRLDLQHGGGCTDHEFAVWWPGLVAPSAPPQVQMHLQHYDFRDVCQALLTRSVWLDLSPLHEVMLGTDRFLISFRGQPGVVDYTFAAPAPPPSEDVLTIDLSCGSKPQ